MELVTIEQVELLMTRAGLTLSPERLEGLREMFEQYRSRLDLLHSVDADDQEVAGIFSPQ
jgi:sulfur transfer protein SufE